MVHGSVESFRSEATKSKQQHRNSSSSGRKAVGQQNNSAATLHSMTPVSTHASFERSASSTVRGRPRRAQKAAGQQRRQQSQSSKRRQMDLGFRFQRRSAQRWAAHWRPQRTAINISSADSASINQNGSSTERLSEQLSAGKKQHIQPVPMPQKPARVAEAANTANTYVL